MDLSEIMRQVRSIQSLTTDRERLAKVGELLGMVTSPALDGDADFDEFKRQALSIQRLTTDRERLAKVGELFGMVEEQTPLDTWLLLLLYLAAKPAAEDSNGGNGGDEDLAASRARAGQAGGSARCVVCSGASSSPPDSRAAIVAGAEGEYELQFNTPDARGRKLSGLCSKPAWINQRLREANLPSMSEAERRRIGCEITG